jgi:hypothetical protein
MNEIVMALCFVEVIGCLATGPQALALYARWREWRDWPRARVQL